jgi:hypothetical protein
VCPVVWEAQRREVPPILIKISFAAGRARYVVEDLVDDVWMDGQPRHTGRGGSAQVTQTLRQIELRPGAAGDFIAARRRNQGKLVHRAERPSGWSQPFQKSWISSSVDARDRAYSTAGNFMRAIGEVVMISRSSAQLKERP